MNHQILIEVIMRVLWLPSHVVLDSPLLHLKPLLVECLDNGGNKVKCTMMVRRTISTIKVNYNFFPLVEHPNMQINFK